MTKEKAIRKAYKILSGVTPLKTDCGKLCDCECCKGDNKTGMILFPGEEKFFNNSEDFKVISDEKNNNLLICSGECERSQRPISCRIFPLVPIISDGNLYVIDDPRAVGICPLIYDEVRLNKKFEKAVYKTGKIFLKNECISDFLYSLTDEISEILSLRKDFLK